MLDWPDMERLRVLAGRAKHDVITRSQKEELRAIVASHAPEAADLPWDDLMDVAYFWLGVYSLAKLGQQAAAASAS